MKAFVPCLILTAHQLCFAGEGTNIIAVSEWSKPVSLCNQGLHDIGIRGRLLILQGMEPAYGGPPTTNGAMTFIEFHCERLDVRPKPRHFSFFLNRLCTDPSTSSDRQPCCISPSTLVALARGHVGNMAGWFCSDVSDIVFAA